MIRLYDGSRLVYSIFCVTTLLDTLNGCCCYIDDKYRLGTVQGSYSFRSQLGCHPELIHEEINWGQEKANADYGRLFMHRGTNKSNQPHIRT